MYQVYKEPLCRRYYATPCSFAGVYCAGALVTLLLTPFFMAYDPYSEYSTAKVQDTSIHRTDP